MNDTITEAIVQKQTFKHAELTAYQRAIVLHALALVDRGGADHFAVDEVSAPFEDARTPGCAIAALATAHVIERSYFHDPTKGINYGVRVSNSKARKAAKVNLWRLCSRAVAATWLTKNGMTTPPPVQGELGGGKWEAGSGKRGNHEMHGMHGSETRKCGEE
jgi:hypothetical protein